jgi:hypothetical protein
VIYLSSVDRTAVTRLLARYQLDLRIVAPQDAIPASYWGDSEAGLQGSTLYARLDTPLHSVLHEAAHYICMSPERRAGLDRDAGGDDAEESAVCLLQLLLADTLASVGAAQLCLDMDLWGYSFRLGSAAAWYEQDCADARAWLAERGVIDAAASLTGSLRL